MIDAINLSNVLVLDIETVSNTKEYADLNETMQKLWDIKSDQIQRRSNPDEIVTSAECFKEKAGIFAEFGKIVCISVGFYSKEKGEMIFRVKSFFGDDEKKLLTEFATLLQDHYSHPSKMLCGHNIKEFDIPYICRRMMILGVPLPSPLQISGKKPWELKYLLDTLELWKFGDYKNYTSLKLLCGVFNIPTPKDDIDGSEVGSTYWELGELNRIEAYCKKDVVATARLLMAYKMLAPLKEEQVIYL